MTISAPGEGGVRAAPQRPVEESAVLVLAVALLTWTLRMIHQSACNTAEVGLNTMLRLCYSDLPVVWQSEVGRGASPAATPSFDQPVVVGYWVQLIQKLTFVTAPIDAPPGELLGRTTVFVGINLMLLGCCFLLLVFCLVWLSPSHPHRGSSQRIGLLMATSVVVFAAGTISWDLIPASLVMLAVVLWASQRPRWAGVALGVAASAAWYPLVIPVVLYALCRRSGQVAGWWRLMTTMAPIWLLLNLPVLVLHPTGWVHQARRWLAPDIGLGSGWHVLSTALRRTLPIWPISAGLVIASLVAIWWLVARAPRRPRLAQVAALAVLAITITTPVFSPQNVLWLAPLVLLARPVWRDWVIFSVGEVAYWAAVWGYLQGNLFTAQPALAYALMIFLRVGVEVYLAWRIVDDILHPWNDPVHADHVDDPTGGILDHAADDFGGHGQTVMEVR